MALSFNDIYRNLGVPVQNLPQQNGLTFDNIYMGNNGQPLATQPPSAGPAAPAPGSAIPPINTNQTNVNPMTGRPYSFMDSMNDANGQLMYDPGQSSLANLLNGRFRTQGDPAFGQIQPMQQGQSPFAAQLVNSGMANQSIQKPQATGGSFYGIPQYGQGSYGEPLFFGGYPTGGMPQMPQTPQYNFNPNMQPNRQPNMGGMGGNGFGGNQFARPMGFDFSNPMNYSGYGNWNQPQQRQSSKIGGR